MIRPGIVLGVARAEARLTRRLVRYWVFMSLAALLGVVVYVYYAVLHWLFSYYSATVAVLNPRYLLGFLGVYYLMVFMFGLVFLGFDVRARDVRDRMAEVVDTLPCTNLELVLGKFLGIMIPSWIPVVLVSLLIGLGGRLGGAPAEALSLVNFSVAMAIPAFTFTLGLVFLVTLLARHRGLAAVALLIAVVGVFAGNLFSPTWLAPLTDVTGAFTVPFPSDIVSSLLDREAAVQRLGIFLAGLGLMVVAAAVHPRLDAGSRGRRALGGLAVFALAAIMLGVVVLGRMGDMNQFRVWKDAHAARAEDPAPDIRAMTAMVRIDPGRELSMELKMRLRAPAGHNLEQALFALNPGLGIEQVSDSQGRALAFRHEDGLVDVELKDALAAGTETELAWTIRGRPDPRFAYLDSSRHLLEVAALDGNVFMLGYDNLIFRRGHVSLPIGVRWLPAAGAEIGRHDSRVRPMDFFELDLTVELPSGWLAAGPGRRRDVSGSMEAGAPRFRFAPRAPVPGAMLVAGRYEGRSVEVNGVQAEVLIAPSHSTSLEFFDDTVSEIRAWLSERLGEAAELGLDYPYDAITLVEVPNSLRGYGGGWRMGSIMGPPALLLMRESSFPTARFDSPFIELEQSQDREGGVPRAKLEALERFFENDFNGGNPFTGVARSFFAHQTAGAGPEGLSLDFVYQDLTCRLVTEKQGYFSAYLFDRNINEIINKTIFSLVARGQQRGLAQVLIDMVTSNIAVWDVVLGIPLSDLDPWEDPKRTINVLTLKGGAMSRSLLDGLGREKTGKFLAALRKRTQGEVYDRADVLEAGREVGVDLEEWLELWIHQTDLPGFIAEDAQLYRASDAEDGTPRYAVRFTLRNDEPVPGLARVVYGVEGGDDGSREPNETDPIPIQARGAVEIGIVSSEPPRSVEVDPYLSLNRGSFEVKLPALDQERIVDEEPFKGYRELEYDPPRPDWIVVDDLSEGFSVVDESGKRGLRLGSQVEVEDTDQGLPVVQLGRSPTRWSRGEHRRAWGKYRHTMAVIRAGKGEHRAIFAATVPEAGPWELQLYVPSREERRGPLGNTRGTWHLTVEDGSGRQNVTFDADAGEDGWNSLGRFELAGGEVRVELSDESEGRLVIADAIRWVPPKGLSAEG